MAGGEGSGEQPRAGEGAAATVAGLEQCPSCDSRFVQPLDWSPITRQRWRLVRRCPECGWQHSGEFGQELVDRYDETLERATKELVAALRLTVRANMQERLDAFVAALGSDAILPEDF